jgi:hypothetical protein
VVAVTAAVLGVAGVCRADDVRTAPVFGITRALPPRQSIAPTYAPPNAAPAQEASIGSALPENTTVLPKTAAKSTGGNSWNECLFTIKAGDTLSAMLRDLGATPEEIKAIAAVLGMRGRDGNLNEGQKLRVLLSPVRGIERLQPMRVMLVGDHGVEAVVALSYLGRYVNVDVRFSEDVFPRREQEDVSAKSDRLLEPPNVEPTIPELPRMTPTAQSKPASEIPIVPIDHSPTAVSVASWPVVPSTSLEPNPKTEASPRPVRGKPKEPKESKVAAVSPQVLPRPELKLSPLAKATFEPPPQYDHVPSVKVVDHVTTQDAVEHWCRGHGIDRGPYFRIMGCAVRSGDSCLVWRIDDGTVRRHEYAHCNGWRHE